MVQLPQAQTPVIVHVSDIVSPATGVKCKPRLLAACSTNSSHISVLLCRTHMESRQSEGVEHHPVPQPSHIHHIYSTQ